MMKKLALAIVGASTVGLSSLAAAEEFPTSVGTFDVSMTATLATDYIWRGQSQTAGAGAIQGSLDIAHESGLYIGTWASNVDSEWTGGSSVEIDYYVGYAGSITDDIGYDLSWNTYTYPKASDLTSKEVIASLNGYGFTVGTKYAYDPNSALYTWIGYDYELPQGFGLHLAYGRTDTKDTLAVVEDNSGVVIYQDTKSKYDDWSVGVSKNFIGLDFLLAYTDTDIKSGTCEAWYGDKDYCDTNVTLSVSKSF
ncbi:hypothetical protein DNJ95_17145 [Stutzerimonas kirkiae]|uniref:Uncharacterized protein n=2 Tax=Stutzerimonas kirkiae TaxID=2211392 RepID=A0A4V2KCI5_9GAMM|nr:hypothetical protein DNJ96_12940 [Stutzerimonas kirkiae]TBU99126.1 hypothetical protein DNJ95_17145 [Stutzerimonas kirkiae]TBV09858.1 hypothetical protein DNK01_18380 [Stutzerimonas kirkiae]